LAIPSLVVLTGSISSLLTGEPPFLSLFIPRGRLRACALRNSPDMTHTVKKFSGLQPILEFVQYRYTINKVSVACVEEVMK
jgi:hypothetical protein